MNDQRTDDRPRHDRALDLAATAVDFDLSTAESSELDAHLATCPSCTRRVVGLRADAHVLSRPLTLLPSPQVDAAVAAAIARRPDRPQRLVLLAAAALVLLGLLGIAAAGASLLRSIDPPSITVLPSPPVIVADASPGPDASPAVASLPPGMIAYVVGPVGSGEVRVVSADGTGDVSCGIGSAPSWSTDGRTIFFAGPPTATADGFPDTFRADADCTGITKAITEAAAPHVSPDGRRIVFRRGMIDLGEAWIADADGSNQRRLPASSSPTWSPDGAWLLAQHVGVVFEFGVMRPDGTDYTALGRGYDPSWTPAGGIVYARSDFPAATTTIRTVALDGLASDQFTAAGEIGWPQMLASGQIIFVLEGDVWRLGPGSSAPARLTQGLLVASRPSLSPDGAWVALATGGTDPGLAIVALDGAVERLRSGAISDIVWHGSPSGPVASSIDPVVLSRVEIRGDASPGRNWMQRMTVYQDGTVLHPDQDGGRVTRLAPDGLALLLAPADDSGLFVSTRVIERDPAAISGDFDSYAVDLRRADGLVHRWTTNRPLPADQAETDRIISLARRIAAHESWLPSEAWLTAPATATRFVPSQFLLKVGVSDNPLNDQPTAELDVADVDWPLEGRMVDFGRPAELPVSPDITWRCGTLTFAEAAAVRDAVSATPFVPLGFHSQADLRWRSTQERVTLMLTPVLPGDPPGCPADLFP